MPPRVNYGIGETVGESQDGQGTCNRVLDAPASGGRLLPIAGHVHAASNEVGDPSQDKASRREHDYLDRLPLAQRFIIGPRGLRCRWRKSRVVVVWRGVDGSCLFVSLWRKKKKKGELFGYLN